MNSFYRLTEALEGAYSKTKDEVVVDLAMDRLIHLIAIVVIPVLVIPQLLGILGPAASCRIPQGSNADFINRYCWESSSVENKICENMTFGGNVSFVDDHTETRKLYGRLPLLLLFEEIFLVLSWICWHYYYFPLLTGYLSAMEMMCEKYFEQLQKIERSHDLGRAYDSCSNFFNGAVIDIDMDGGLNHRHGQESVLLNQMDTQDRGPRNPENAQDGGLPMMVVLITGMVRKVVGLITGMVRIVVGLIRSTVNCIIVLLYNQNDGQDYGRDNSRFGCVLRYIHGTMGWKMRDYHFLSMLCYENAILAGHMLYFRSVYHLAKIGKRDETSDPRRGGKSVARRGGTSVAEPDASALYLPISIASINNFCNSGSFDGVTLSSLYLLKHLLTAILSVIVLGALYYYGPSWTEVIAYSSSRIYRCHLLEVSTTVSKCEECCQPCLIIGSKEAVFVYSVAVILLLIVFSSSLYHFCELAYKKDVPFTHFFENLTTERNQLQDLRDLSEGKQEPDNQDT